LWTDTNYNSDGKLADVKNYRYGKTNFEAREDNENFNSAAFNNPNTHTGIGEAVVDPNILTYMSYSAIFPYGNDSWLIRNMVLGLNRSGKHNFANPFTSDFDLYYPYDITLWHWECVFSPTNFRRLVNGRPPVIYSDVTVYYGDIGENDVYTPEKTIGKTVYKYDIYDIGKTIYKYDIYDIEPDIVFFESLKEYGNTLSYETKGYPLKIKESDNWILGGGFAYKKWQIELKYHTNRGLLLGYAFWNAYYTQVSLSVSYKLLSIRR